MSAALSSRVVGALLLLGAALSAAAQPADLPARTLGGADVAVPGDLPPGALLIVGFSRGSNEQTEPWREGVDTMRPPTPAYSVLVLEGAPRWVRGLIVRGVRRAVPKEDRNSVLIVTKNAAGWRALVGFEADREDAAYVVRTDAAGATCFRHVGPVSDEAVRASQDAACMSGDAG